jgi:hypothetical protein
MTRKADPEIVKLKRKVIKLKSDLDSVAEKLSVFLGYPYSPSQWDRISKEFDEETAAIHEVTVARYSAACNISACKNKKRQLRNLANKGNISKSQSQVYSKIKLEVADAISSLTSLPDLGTSFKDWEALPAEFKVQSVGHPRVSLEESFVTIRSELKLTHKMVNDLEEDGKNSTIDEILEEEDKIAVNAGRKKLPLKVAEIEELERKKRTIIVQIDEINKEPEKQEIKVGRGKRKLSKQERIEKKSNTIIAINEQISSLESNLDAKEYGMRFKRVLEREKRYAKQDGRTKDFKVITKKLSAIESVIEKIEKGAIKVEKSKVMIDKVVNSLDITVESAVKSIIDNAILAANSPSEVNEAIELDEEHTEDNILKMFETMDLPKF